MRVAVYDKNPGPGLNQWFLAFSWKIGCFLHKLFGKLDDYHGASSWEDAFDWLQSRPGSLVSVQYWGHGSAGMAWLGLKPLYLTPFKKLAEKMTPQSVFWFRTCSTFKGENGYAASKYIADTLNCVVAGHTRIIGIMQSGLHTRKPGEEPRWAVSEGDVGHPVLVSLGWQFGSNTIFCLRATVPEGW